MTSRRLQGLVQSDIRRMTRECERVGGFYSGTAGERLLRFCFAKEDGVLAEACSRLRSA